ncbi:hypothetical protein p1B49 (plasmid) [Aromatoleum aromaticum EbN1]|uniref:Uncharacterized protein n=1 Tax=Aromatoleum aromaticum (strain DSM 19018 / LMG 30748 / EbN1) TaxID=76114 RepID=Q5NXD2_AROAE|nr:hypothetical protein p1B49 [Aromatoleum aromaticum EbN1]
MFVALLFPWRWFVRLALCVELCPVLDTVLCPVFYLLCPVLCAVLCPVFNCCVHFWMQICAQFWMQFCLHRPEESI